MRWKVSLLRYGNGVYPVLKIIMKLKDRIYFIKILFRLCFSNSNFFPQIKTNSCYPHCEGAGKYLFSEWISAEGTSWWWSLFSNLFLKFRFFFSNQNKPLLSPLWGRGEVSLFRVDQCRRNQLMMIPFLVSGCASFCAIFSTRILHLRYVIFGTLSSAALVHR